VEWEEEIDSRMQVLNKKIDLQRLKRMKGIDTISEKAQPTSKKATNRKTTRAKTKSQVESDSESDKEIKEAGKAAAKNSLESDDESTQPIKKTTPGQKRIEDSDDDELFNSEEEKRISEGTHKLTQAKLDEDSAEEEADDDSENEFFRVTKSKRKKQQSSKRKTQPKSKRRKYDSEEEEDEESEEDEDGLSDVGGETNITSIKEQFGASKRTYERGDGNRMTKQKNYDTLRDLEKHWKEEKDKELPPEDNDFDPADLTDYIKITLRRDQLVLLLNEPFFQNYVKGCFIRYSLGAIENTPVYRMCEILKAEFEGRPYKVPAPNGNGQIETKLRLTLSTGGSVKEKVKIDRVSNHTIQQNELDFHLQGLTNRKQKGLTKRDVKVLRFYQKQYRDRVYTHDEIKEMVSKKVGLNKVLATEYTNAMNTLIQKRQEAIQNRDDDALRAIQKTISQLEAENDRQKIVFEKAYRKQIEANKQMKENNTRRDLLASMQRKKEDQEAREKGVIPNSIADPFIRRETRPSNLWVSKLKTEGTADPKTPTPRAAPAPKVDKQSVNYEFVIPEEANMDEVIFFCLYVHLTIEV
jgi:hypothetical protein